MLSRERTRPGRGQHIPRSRNGQSNEKSPQTLRSGGFFSGAQAAAGRLENQWMVLGCCACGAASSGHSKGGNACTHILTTGL